MIKPHILFFIFGFIYYLIIPIAIGSFEVMIDMPGMISWQDTFNSAQTNLPNYFFIITAFFIAFLSGSSLRYNIFLGRRKTVNLSEKNKKIDLRITALIFLFIVLYFIANNLGLLFTGYETYDLVLLGAMATINSVSTVLLIYVLLNSKVSNLQSWLFFISIIFCSVFLIGLGSRMYVLIPIIAIATYKFYYARVRWKGNIFYLYFALVIILLLMIGTLRIGEHLTLDFLAYLLFAEPTYTWWSTGSFLSLNQLLALDFPSNYISSFLNFLPNFLIDDKQSLIQLIRDKYFYISPLGADSIFVSIQGNFGWFLGFFFMLLVGFFYASIETLSKRSNFFMAYYIGIVSVLPFQFFRDGFGILNKQLFWNMLIVPAMLIFISILISKLASVSKN